MRLLEAAPATGAASAAASSSSVCPSSLSLLGPLVSRRFTFDRVWDQSDSARCSGASSQRCVNELYAGALQADMAGAVEGRSVCVVAHGASSAAASDTLSGDAHTRGMVALAMDQLFASRLTTPSNRTAPSSGLVPHSRSVRCCSSFRRAIAQ